MKKLNFNENITKNSEHFKSFEKEMLNLCKARHANLILFVGACMKIPDIAIIMSYCRGVTLHKYLHCDVYQRPNFDKVILFASQIAKGMGYLHARNIVHKDLRTKNIFIDGNKAIISDFDLYSMTKICVKQQ